MIQLIQQQQLPVIVVVTLELVAVKQHQQRKNYNETTTTSTFQSTCTIHQCLVLIDLIFGLLIWTKEDFHYIYSRYFDSL